MERQQLFQHDGQILKELLKGFLLKSLPPQSTLHEAFRSDAGGEAILGIRKFDSATAALVNMDLGQSESGDYKETIRVVVLQAHGTRRANEASRFDCVTCINSNSESDAEEPFRAQVLKFFQISARSIVDARGRQLTDDDLVFVLVGAFREVLPTLFKSGYGNTMVDPAAASGSGPPKLFTRAKLLGTTLAKLPANHIKMNLHNWQAQRFSVISLRDIKSTIHVIPLTRIDGTPFRALFDADDKMSDSIALAASGKQLHLLNTSIYL